MSYHSVQEQRAETLAYHSVQEQGRELTGAHDARDEHVLSVVLDADCVEADWVSVVGQGAAVVFSLLVVEGVAGKRTPRKVVLASVGGLVHLWSTRDKR